MMSAFVSKPGGTACFWLANLPSSSCCNDTAMGSWYLIIVGHPSGAQLELYVQREDTNRRWQDLAVNAGRYAGRRHHQDRNRKRQP